MCVAYYRVSTSKQGVSGLGLEAQRETVRKFLGDNAITAEFTEVESGRCSDRPALAQALAAARLYRCPLVVANVSRLTRSVGFLSRLLEAGVDVRFCDIPQIEGPTGRLILTQMAAIAEWEAGIISDRTKKALAAARARGVKLGGHRGHVMSPEARKASLAIRQAKAAQRRDDLKPLLTELRNQGIVTLNGIARALTARCITTPRGRARWSAEQVKQIA